MLAPLLIAPNLRRCSVDLGGEATDGKAYFLSSEKSNWFFRYILLEDLKHEKQIHRQPWGATFRQMV